MQLSKRVTLPSLGLIPQRAFFFFTGGDCLPYATSMIETGIWKEDMQELGVGEDRLATLTARRAMKDA